jgi:hypothetical protein
LSSKLLDALESRRDGPDRALNVVGDVAARRRLLETDEDRQTSDEEPQPTHASHL